MKVKQIRHHQREDLETGIMVKNIQNEEHIHKKSEKQKRM